MTAQRILKNTLHFIFTVITIAILCTSCSAKRWYVGAEGDDENKGNSEAKAFKTLSKALSAASGSKKDIIILVTGTLEPEGGDAAAFTAVQTGEGVVTITGKADQIAVLKGDAEKDLPVLRIADKAKIRLENIEISGGLGGGIVVAGGSSLTLGTGAKITGNTVNGIVVKENSTLVMEGGEVTATQGTGVWIDKECTFTLTDGTINHNTASNGEWGGGVWVGGSFTMEGGEISDNVVDNTNGVGKMAGARGGGVCVFQEATFTLKGGKIINNRSAGYLRRGGVTNGSGGGVIVVGCENGSTAFIMEGGEISGNSAERFGGGVVLVTDQGDKGTFTMTGGKISGNTARGGGGIQNYGGRFTVSISGGDISGNTPDDNIEGWSW